MNHHARRLAATVLIAGSLTLTSTGAAHATTDCTAQDQEIQRLDGEVAAWQGRTAVLTDKVIQLTGDLTDWQDRTTMLTVKLVDTRAKVDRKQATIERLRDKLRDR